MMQIRCSASGAEQALEPTHQQRRYAGLYKLSTPEQLIADFQRDIARRNHENRDS